MKYGEVSDTEYHNGIDALKWSLLEKRSKVERCEQQLQWAKEEVQKIEGDLKQIMEARP